MKSPALPLGEAVASEARPKEPLFARLRGINYARLNHVFIPSKKPDRDRLRAGVAGRVLGPFFSLVGSFSREGRAFALLCLLVAGASVDVAESQVFVLFSALIGLLCASLAVRRLYALGGCRIELENAPRVAVGEPLAFGVTLVNAGDRERSSIRVERPFLPWDGKWLDAPVAIARVGGRERVTVRPRARFAARGEHHLDPFEAAALVPVGLSMGPRVSSIGARFVVVPRIARVTRVELAHRSPIRDGRSATHAAPGDGEIAGVRPYRLGDPLKHLHVRTWARTGTPHVRQYVDERSDRVALVVALDATLAPEARVEAAISLAAGIAARLTAADGPGLDHLVLGERSVRIEPRRGRAALELVLDALAKHVAAQREETPMAHLEPLLPSLSTVVLVTSDHAPRRRALRDEIERAGAPCRWIEVIDDGGPAEAPRALEVGPITRLEPLAC